MSRINNTSGRLLVKGMRCHIAFDYETAFHRLYGLKAVKGLNLERTGEVDATELWQGPDNLPIGDNREEQYFTTHQYVGTKKFPPLELSLNHIPRSTTNPNPGFVPDIGRVDLSKLIEAYTMDRFCHVSFQTRDGREFTFEGQIFDLTQVGEEGQLWNGDLKIMPTTWWIYRQLPINYQPWGTTAPRFGPPGVHSTQLTWAAADILDDDVVVANTRTNPATP